MPGCLMPFPEDWHEFLKDYSFDDSQEVYTNGSRLIPVFRVEQLIEHLLKAQEPVGPNLDVDEWRCGNCGHKLEHQELLGDNVLFHEQYNYCPNCGKAVKWA